MVWCLTARRWTPLAFLTHDVPLQSAARRSSTATAWGPYTYAPCLDEGNTDSGKVSPRGSTLSPTAAPCNRIPVSCSMSLNMARSMVRSSQQSSKTKNNTMKLDRAGTTQEQRASLQTAITRQESEHTWKCGELKLYFHQSAIGYKRK